MQPQAIAFNKPYGMLSQFTPEAGHPGLGDCIQLPGLYPAGRLDHDSEGLLILTSDGRLAQRLTSPEAHVAKRYWVQVEGLPDDEALAGLASGVVIQGRPTRPAQARRLEPPPVLPERSPPIRHREAIPTSWLELEIREGRNRQVRRMTAAVGHPTLRLWRAQVGPVRLGDLPVGAWRPLRPEELLELWAHEAQGGAGRGPRRPRPRLR